MKTIDYYFWMNSDWAYLGADRLEALAARHQARIRYLPVDLPDVYARTGGVLLGQRASRAPLCPIHQKKRGHPAKAPAVPASIRHNHKWRQP